MKLVARSVRRSFFIDAVLNSIQASSKEKRQ
jgi:hypothetical protein